MAHRPIPNNLTIEVKFDTEVWGTLTDEERTAWVDDVIQAVSDEAHVTAFSHRYPALPQDEYGHDLKFCLELGVEGEAHRRCALEVGLFATRAEAEGFAHMVHGRTVSRAEDDARALGKSIDPYDREANDDRKPIIGATVNVFTSAEGTVENIDIY